MGDNKQNTKTLNPLKLKGQINYAKCLATERIPGCAKGLRCLGTALPANRGNVIFFLGKNIENPNSLKY